MKTYEEVKQGIADGTINAPKVMYKNGEIEFTRYQLAVHKYNLGIMKAGMTCRGIKLKDLKVYYGLKGKSAKDCYTEFCLKFNM